MRAQLIVGFLVEALVTCEPYPFDQRPHSHGESGPSHCQSIGDRRRANSWGGIGDVHGCACQVGGQGDD